MSNIAILGAMWGDEGKGHITHHFSPQFDWVIRFNGGANAGHTIYRDGKKFVHNLLPSVDFRHPHVKAFLGSGMVIDMEQLKKEILEAEKEYPGVCQRIYVDPEAFLVLPYHKEVDKNTNAHIGSTNRGIGPAYADKIGRKGLRLRDFVDGRFVNRPNNFLFDQPETRIAAEIYGELYHMGVQFRHVISMGWEFRKARLLFEGAQGILLDINHGTYPYVSCSDCTIGGIYASGFSNHRIDTVYGVAKCYTTKVGEGPFPTELKGEEADELRKLGNEFGATTGRPRRVGWLDVPALSYSCNKAGINKLILTKFDILAGREEVPICTGYQQEPVCANDFFQAQPWYVKAPGWADCRASEQMRDFMKYVEYGSGRPVAYISCGTGEDDILPWRSDIE